MITPSQTVEEFLKKKLPILAIHPLADGLARASLSERDEILRGLRRLRHLLENTAEQK